MGSSLGTLSVLTSSARGVGGGNLVTESASSGHSISGSGVGSRCFGAWLVKIITNPINIGKKYLIEVGGLVADPGPGNRVQGVAGVTADIGCGGPRSELGEVNRSVKQFHDEGVMVASRFVQGLPLSFPR